MVNITYHKIDGTDASIDVPLGQSLMEGAVRNGVEGIVAECGGSCSCATCHVYVDESSESLFDPPSEEEQELLDFLEDARPNSRLSCQLIATERCAFACVTVRDSN